MKILVIRRDNIGDLVCTTPLFAALRRRYPDAHIAALVNSYNAAVLAGNPQLNAVHAYTKLKHRGPGESALRILADRLRLMARLRRARFDVVLLAKGAYDRHGLALARPLAPGRIVGFGIDPTLPAPANAELHEVEVMMQLGAALDAREPPGPLCVYPAPERAAEWRARFPALASDRRWVALHISAREPGRVWPVEHFVALAQALSRDTAIGILLFWAPGPADDPRHPGDDARAAAIAMGVGKKVNLIPAQTKTLEELIAVLSLCEAFIGADGGAMHIAAGLGLPTVALFENLPYKKRHWHPWQVPYEMVCPATRDIADITPEQVVEAWRRLADYLPWHTQASS